MSSVSILAQIAEKLVIYRPILQLFAAVLVFLIFWGLKKKFTSLLTELLYRLLNHKKQWISKESFSAAMIPFRSIFALLGVYIALSIVGWTHNTLVIHGLRIAAIGLLAWIAVRFWDACSPLFFDANKAIGDQLNLNLSKTLMNFLSKAVKGVIIVFATLVIIAETGADVTALITGLGLGGLTFALAAQDTASNLFSGLVILLDRPFVVEDWIQTPDLEGVVEDITFRSTRIRTFTNAQVVVPNSTLTSKPITNWSRMEKRRVTFRIGLEYGTTSAQLQRCVKRIEELLNNHPQVVKDSAVVNFDAFDASSLSISVLYHCKQTAYGPYQKVKEDINLQIMSIIEEEGCSFAFPTQTLHIQQDEK